MKQEFMARLSKCIGLDLDLIEDLQERFEVTVSEETINDALQHFRSWRNPDDMQMIITRSIYRTVIDRYKKELDEKKFVMKIQPNDHEPYLEYDGERIVSNMQLLGMVREKKEIEQWEAQKNAPREFHLTAEDKKILLSAGYLNEDMEQIEIEANVCRYIRNKKGHEYEIERDEAIKAVGREQWLYCIGRTAFHWSTSDECLRGKDTISYESGIVGRYVNKYEY